MCEKVPHPALPRLLVARPLPDAKPLPHRRRHRNTFLRLCEPPRTAPDRSARRAGSGGRPLPVAARHAERRALAHSFRGWHFHAGIRPVRLVCRGVRQAEKRRTVAAAARRRSECPAARRLGRGTAPRPRGMDQIHAHADLASTCATRNSRVSWARPFTARGSTRTSCGAPY